MRDKVKPVRLATTVHGYLGSAMKTFLLFVLFMLLAVVVILLAVILGDSDARYFAWLVGTAMIVLIAAAGAWLLNAKEEDAAQRAKNDEQTGLIVPPGPQT